ncbi:hypothetical protein CcarbDRAFT_4830 [Clostridium carboxidivorans P7]|uniref:Uncharacterized protein n=1 Tax=Clostridium carboxidivorans P7 TaxID=536227 RepID=C6Q1B3_9CLOT|nr:hypothetical protein [Clostridium carboxidivorans]EET84722.1 hypothetical protein CcarbDRAFT_4830 [Clostridium carboxidivorans P7]EFG88524.1 hypothetical protein CLCAR_1745 [Clostridium carboxidivorans P7]
MNLITWIGKKDIDIAFVIVLIGIVISPIVHYSWIISIIACLFLKDD